MLAKQLPATIADHSHSEINRLTVINQDILTLMPSDLTDQPTALVANLPYNVAVPALLHLLAEFPSIRTVMVMVQAEVAERLAAEPGGKDYGVPSAKVRFYGNVRRHGMVSPTVFWPIPRVYSGLVRIDRYETSPWPTDAAFRDEVFKLIDIGFAQRRKTSRNAFADWAGSGNESAERLLAASIDPSRRGETLGIADFVRLLQRAKEAEGEGRGKVEAAQQAWAPAFEVNKIARFFEDLAIFFIIGDPIAPVIKLTNSEHESWRRSGSLAIALAMIESAACGIQLHRCEIRGGRLYS